MLRYTFLALATCVLAFTAQFASAGLLDLNDDLLAPSGAGDPTIPDLIYHSDTGEVELDVDASSIIGYVLKNNTNSFLGANHTPFLGGVATSISSEISEAAFSSPVGVNSIGLVFPSGMDLAGLTALLSENSVSRSFGSQLVPFDLVVLTGGDGPVVPEPATVTLWSLGLVGLSLYAWRRRKSAA